jgi:hypothetical protein
LKIHYVKAVAVSRHPTLQEQRIANTVNGDYKAAVEMRYEKSVRDCVAEHGAHHAGIGNGRRKHQFGAKARCSFGDSLLLLFALNSTPKEKGQTNDADASEKFVCRLFPIIHTQSSETMLMSQRPLLAHRRRDVLQHAHVMTLAKANEQRCTFTRTTAPALQLP